MNRGNQVGSCLHAWFSLQARQIADRNPVDHVNVSGQQFTDCIGGKVKPLFNYHGMLLTIVDHKLWIQIKCRKFIIRFGQDVDAILNWLAIVCRPLVSHVDQGFWSNKRAA